MTSILKPFIALYAAMFSISMGLGVLSSFLSLRLTTQGVSTQVTGMILTAYFTGNVVGAFYCTRLIKSVGHIRAFTAFAATATAMVMLHGVYMSAPAWAVFRFFSGIATIGLFMVIESWLNECTQPKERGKVFSMYMVIFYLGTGLSQQLLNIGDVNDQTLFFVIGFLLISCIIPIALTRSIHPQISKIEPIQFKTIVQKTPLGLIGCFTAGLTTSAFYAMGPVFCNQLNLSTPQLSSFMTITVIGGLLLQWPVGSFSDRFDRSAVIQVLGGLLAVVSFVIILSAQSSYFLFMAATGVFGGFMFTIYPVAVARAHDMFEPKDVVNVSSYLLLFFGIGSMIGPVASSMVIERIGSPYGFYIYFSGIGILLTAVTFYLRQKEIAQIIPVEEQVDFVILKHTSQMAMRIDPRREVTDTDPDDPEL